MALTADWSVVALHALTGTSRVQYHLVNHSAWQPQNVPWAECMMAKFLLAMCSCRTDQTRSN